MSDNIKGKRLALPVAHSRSLPAFVSTDRNVPGVVCSIVGALDEPTTTGTADTVTGDGPIVVGSDVVGTVDGRVVVGCDVFGLDVGPSVR